MALLFITCLEKLVIDLEAKDKICHKDVVAIKGFIQRHENLDGGFRGYHWNIIDLVEEDEGVQMEEQAKLDGHEEKVTNLMSHLLKLGGEDEGPVPSGV